jgi:hypothetical protein
VSSKIKERNIFPLTVRRPGYIHTFPGFILCPENLSAVFCPGWTWEDSLSLMPILVVHRGR